MTRPNTLEDIECKIKDSLDFPKAVSVARINGFALIDKFSEVRKIQLGREIARAERQENMERTPLLKHRLKMEILRQNYVVSQSERELVTPVQANKGEAVVQGRVIRDTLGVPELRLSLCDPNGEIVATTISKKGGYFDMATQSTKPLALLVSGDKGQTIHKITGRAPLEIGQTVYIDIDISGRTPQKDIPPATSCDPVVPEKDPDTPQAASVPLILGLSPERAQAVLEKLKLEIKMRGELDTTNKDEVGLIVQQKPKPPQTLQAGKTVDIWIGRMVGHPMPVLTGVKLSTAISRLEAVGLQLDTVETEARSTGHGKVLDQFPPKGQNVKAGDMVQLRIASGNAAQDYKSALVLISHKTGQTSAKDLKALLTAGKIDTLAKLKRLAIAKDKTFLKKLGITRLDDPRAASLTALKPSIKSIIGTFTKG